jgi:hypothetical protein
MDLVVIEEDGSESSISIGVGAEEGQGDGSGEYVRPISGVASSSLQRGPSSSGTGDLPRGESDQPGKPGYEVILARLDVMLQAKDPKTMEALMANLLGIEDYER